MSDDASLGMGAGLAGVVVTLVSVWLIVQGDTQAAMFGMSLLVILTVAFYGIIVIGRR